MGRLFKRWRRAALAAGWVFLAGGCAAPTDAPVPAAPASAAVPARPSQPQPQPQPQPPADKRFVIAPELAGVLRVVSVSLHNPSGRFLNIQVNVQNLTDAPQQFSYRIEWFDSDGERLPVAGGEFPWMLRPREVLPIAATAPTPAAADFGIAFLPTVK